MHQARKRFGQHFLHDAGKIQKIVNAIAPRRGERVVEIGPGLGAITFPLLGVLGELDAIEIDRDVIGHLTATTTALGQLRIYEADALAFDFGELRGEGERLRLVGNLPYNISTPLLFRLIDFRSHIRDMHFLLQKEVVDRMAANAGDESYGRLTAMLAPWVRVDPLFDIGPGAFKPPPKVTSTFVRVTPHAVPPFVLSHPAAYAKVVSAGFSQRRKTLRNALKQLLSAEAIASVGIDPGLRAEVIPPEGFAALAALLAASC